MKTFNTNTTYKMGFAGDSNLFTNFKVTRRTAKSVWLTDTNGNLDGEQRFAIKVYNGEEYVKPLGNYSMAPVLKAGKLA